MITGGCGVLERQRKYRNGFNFIGNVKQDEKKQLHGTVRRRLTTITIVHICIYNFVLLMGWDGCNGNARSFTLSKQYQINTHNTVWSSARKFVATKHTPPTTHYSTQPCKVVQTELKWWWAIRKSIAYALLRLHKLVGSAIHDDDDNVSTTTTTFPNRFISRRILRLYLTRNGHMYVCLPACLLRLYYTQPNANWYECETQNGNKARMSSIRVKG